MDKPRVKKIPKQGLSYKEQYADDGDLIQYWPLLSRGDYKHDGSSLFGFVHSVHKNKYGRISYNLTNGRQIMTEELTPLKHKGLR